MQEIKLKYAYFPGCASKQLTKEYDITTRIACRKLGIKLIDIPEFSCCGAGVLKEKSHNLNLSLNARNIALAELRDLDIVSICSTCVVNLRKDFFEIKNDPDKKALCDRYLNSIKLSLKGKCEIKHLLWVLEQDYGFENIKSKIIKPLTGLKIATYYGCHILRPGTINGQYQNSENPKNFENFIKALGGIPVDLESKKDCCGFHITLTNKKTAVKMSSKYLSDAKNNNADLIVTNCPFCHMQMDLYQEKFNMPVLHFTQLLCLALGVKPGETGLKRHIVKLPKKILNRFR
ncbi:CoB--CoM heterodisulfide reductase iron-sulfur subunit B family protein [Candidatus Peregrinibacteria bacterium]|nr:CoB--CoM heterodisulfide reductase iron-sulfur subunit B family protein [Candidatus Peregrinibacteria bacterium]